LLEALNLPTKRPFKKEFMSQSEKQIHSMVQRLTFLEKVSTKERTVKVAENAEIKRKREAKV
jgi:hypothetical protein